MEPPTTAAIDDAVVSSKDDVDVDDAWAEAEAMPEDTDIASAAAVELKLDAAVVEESTLLSPPPVEIKEEPSIAAAADDFVAVNNDVPMVTDGIVEHHDNAVQEVVEAEQGQTEVSNDEAATAVSVMDVPMTELLTEQEVKPTASVTDIGMDMVIAEPQELAMVDSV